jgi:hypothetical protein
MVLTRLDCDFFRGDRAPADSSSFVALNPFAQPSRLVFAGSSVVRQGLGSQVAYRLALDYFVHGVDSHYATGQGQAGSEAEDEAVVGVLEAAFRSANSSVYSFGHKLAAGGRMAASLLGVAIENGRFATGRVGTGSVYLFRGNQLFPFFEVDESESLRVGDAPEFPEDGISPKRTFVGSNSIVDVELASVGLQGQDVVCVFSRPLTSLNETLLFESLENLYSEGFPLQRMPNVATRVCGEVFTEPESISFAMVLGIGPDVVYCGDAVANGE